MVIGHVNIKKNFVMSISRRIFILGQNKNGIILVFLHHIKVYMYSLKH